MVAELGSFEVAPALHVGSIWTDVRDKYGQSSEFVFVVIDFAAFWGSLLKFKKHLRSSKVV